jgi:hypothetical protein
MENKYYAVAEHGTAGLEWSHGYAKVWENPTPEPKNSQTMTVEGPFGTREAAQARADILDRQCGMYLPMGQR